MDVKTWQAAISTFAAVVGLGTALWAVYNYRMARRAAAAKWVRDLHTEFYTDHELLIGRELLEWDFEPRLRQLLERRVTDRDIPLDKKQRKDIRVVDRVLNFLEQLIYLERDGHFATSDRRVFFEYWFDLMGAPAKAALHRYLARCGYENLTRELGLDHDDYIAFYGTLMEDQREREQQDFGGRLEYVGPCQVPGLLVDLGEWPGLLRHGDPGASATAELWRVKDYEVFRSLDPFERYDPRQPASSYYHRLVVRLRTPPSVDAWVYYLAERPQYAVDIPGGDWASYLAVRNARDGWIRAAAPDDAAGIDALAAELLEPEERLSADRVLRLVEACPELCFVCEHDDALVGYALAEANLPACHDFRLVQLAVRPGQQAKARADRLADRVAAAARTTPATAITWHGTGAGSGAALDRLAARLGSTAEPASPGERRIPTTGRP